MVNFTAIQITTFSANTLSGLKSYSEQLNEISNDINNNLINPQHNIETSTKEPFNLETNLSVINKPTQRTLEQSLVDTVQTKTHIQALLKMLEIENELYDQSLGKIFNQKV